MFVTNAASSFFVLCRLAVAFPHPSVPQANGDILIIRASEEVNPNAVTDTTCLNSDAAIDFHDQNVATLSICGGIQGAIEKCGGALTSTTGQSGTAKFTLNPTVAGATINVSKGRWESCIRAARAVCPTGSFKSVCKGGASEGDIAFTLDNP